MNYMVDPENDREYQQGVVATTMIFKGGPQGGRDPNIFWRADQGGGYQRENQI